MYLVSIKNKKCRQTVDVPLALHPTDDDPCQEEKTNEQQDIPIERLSDQFSTQAVISSSVGDETISEKKNARGFKKKIKTKNKIVPLVWLFSFLFLY